MFRLAYGDTLADTFEIIQKKRFVRLREIKQHKEQLKVLLQLGRVEYFMDQGEVVYQVVESIPSLVRYGTYLLYAQKQYNDSQILKQLLLQGICYLEESTTLQRMIKDLVVVQCCKEDTQSLPILQMQQEQLQQSVDQQMRTQKPKPKNQVAMIQNGLDGTRKRRTAEFESIKMYKKQVLDCTLYRVYFGRLEVLIRNQQIVQVASQAIHPLSGSLMKLVLNAQQHQHPLDAVRVSVRWQTFAEQLPEVQKLSSSEKSSVVRTHLDQLSSIDRGHPEFLYTIDQQSYTVGTEKLVRAIQWYYIIEPYLAAMFDSVALRIVRTIKAHTILDEKSISTKALVDTVECRKILFMLYKDGIIQWQIVPRSQDRAPNRALYTYRINEQYIVKLRDRVQFIINNAVIKYMSIDQKNDVKELFKLLNSNIDRSLLDETAIKLEQTVLEARKQLMTQIIRLQDMLSFLSL